MKTVTAAILRDDAGRILIARRAPDESNAGMWEFPGGKLEPGESLQDGLLRELQEELGITVRVGQRLASVTHRYPSFTVTLHPFCCDQLSGTITLHEHQASCWLPPARLRELDWAEADWPIINALASP